MNNNIHFKEVMGATEAEVRGLENLAQATIINFGSPEIQERIKKKKKVLIYAKRALQKISKDKVSLILTPNNLIPLIPVRAVGLGFPYPLKLMLICCSECIDELESKLNFHRDILNKAPCGDTFVASGDLCPFCGKLYVGSFCDSITDYLALYGYNRKFTKKNPPKILQSASKKQEFHYWTMDQFPRYIFIDSCYQLVGCVIKSQS